ncbi:MAG: tRNA dihydrouridine synthase DusB [Planctomycetota bacterium]|nr:tRNA dihydrouridine synthase DusB [Planctomycetota bacterium]MDP6762355.1 tRNA dihydrouridine synthase DusB [Planctomycetota bacterium]MDP6990028.1 tRNA dihydrouridine synthase DusB [Planctomycetota bacterium]
MSASAGTAVAAPGEFAPLQVGPLSIWPPVVLAPMAGVTNVPFRRLCRDLGAGLAVTEMITARGFREGNPTTLALARGGPGEHPRAVQIYGSDPADVAAMVAALVDDGVDLVDMNFGCPVPKVTRQGGGSAIPVRPRLLARLVSAAVEAAGSVPVTIKVRKGIDESLSTYLDAGRVAVEEGAAAIGLHGRTAAQLYSGRADREAIARLVEAVPIPVLGNGDIWEWTDGLAMMRETGCAGIIIGRGCLGRPWLFGELAAAFEGHAPPPPPTMGEIVPILLDHARGLVECFGVDTGMRQTRKWCAWYTKGFRGARAVRAELLRVSTPSELESLLAGLDPAEPFPRSALRAQRAKRGRTQRVRLPEGYLDDRDDDRPPRSARLEASERALSGG